MLKGVTPQEQEEVKLESELEIEDKVVKVKLEEIVELEEVKQ